MCALIFYASAKLFLHAVLGQSFHNYFFLGPWASVQCQCNPGPTETHSQVLQQVVFFQTAGDGYKNLTWRAGNAIIFKPLFKQII